MPKKRKQPSMMRSMRSDSINYAIPTWSVTFPIFSFPIHQCLTQAGTATKILYPYQDALSLLSPRLGSEVSTRIFMTRF